MTNSNVYIFPGQRHSSPIHVSYASIGLDTWYFCAVPSLEHAKILADILLQFKQVTHVEYSKLFSDETTIPKGIESHLTEDYSGACDKSLPSIETDLNLLSSCTVATEKIVQLAQEMRVSIVVSLVDTGGHEWFHYRMQNAPLIGERLAKKKAETAILFQTPSSNIQNLTQPGASLYNLESICQGSIVSFGGGIPIYQNENLIGAIGISGAPDPAIDELIANFFIRSFLANFTKS